MELLIAHLFFLLGFGLLLALGIPISFALGIVTLSLLVLKMETGPALSTLAHQMTTGIDSFALLAIPFFILSGELMNRGGVARRLVNLAKFLLGRYPGGLAFVHILAAILFGTISGSAVACAAAIGGFMIPMMKREGYDLNFSTAVNISSSTIGLLIPPSNILIVYSLASGGVSIGALFLAGYLPGILVGLLLMGVAGVIASRRGYPVTAPLRLREGLLKFLDALPALFLIFLVIGGIVAGYFTATEASAVAVLYTFLLCVFIYREIKWRELPRILVGVATTTSIVMLLISASMAMSWILAYLNIPQKITASLLSFSQSPIVILLLINLILIAVGIFMDMTPAVLIFTPIFLPVALKLGLSPVHFGIIMVLNLCLGLCTPPVGSVLFVGCAISGISISRVIKPLLPFFLALLTALLLVTFIPEISLLVPRLFGY